MKTILSLAVGLLLGVALFHPLHTKANSVTSTHILITTVGITDFTAITADINGATIVGMSCVPKPMPKAPDAAVCYVATAPFIAK